ncbi:kinase-like protein [Zopfia rhizophila CBS 207.26]|uniref:Kinase-like protein n=1 Tax=Zopfia rhizophila CBS 207.26 TaxID=1314779 RepID=A0A6A6EY14_9PEZI|nr:kinase-like protein [Zopfia rhizophila CBS 207.26]
MAAEAPCTACSWTSERQGSCRYDSHVKLFYGVSDRRVWSLGSNFILKERSNQPPNFEARNIQFLKENTTIPVPTVVEEWNEENERYFMLTKRIRGDALNTLRQLHSPHMQSLGEQLLYSAFLFPNGYGLPHGPLSSDDELWTEMETALKSVPKKARWRLQERMPSAGPYTFTHRDLTNVNIIIEDGNLTGILNWEASGYFPVWWEFTCAGIGLGQEDQEWKALLRKHMPSYTEAYEFWLDFYTLYKYPNLNERGEALLSELQHE